MIQNINVGATANDGTGDLLRNAFIKINSNFDEIELWFSDVLTTSSAIPISQITGLQTQLNSISNSISLLTSDVTDINAAIASINDTLNEQNISITDLYAQVTALQTLVNTKIGDAPVDGLTYGRKDGAWVEVSGGSTGSFVPYTGATANVDLGVHGLTAGGGIQVTNSTGNLFNQFEFGTFYGSDPFRQLKFKNYGYVGGTWGVNRSVILEADIENGIYLGMADTDAQRNIYITPDSLSLNAIDNTTFENNYLSITPTQTVSLKEVYSNEAFTLPFNDKGYFSVREGSIYKTFYFTSTDTSDDDFGTVSLNMNPEEPISFIKSRPSDSTSTAINMSSSDALISAVNSDSSTSLNVGVNTIDLQVNGPVESSSTTFYDDRTEFGRKVISNEGFERSEDNTGYFFVRKPGHEYLGIDFLSNGDVEGTPNHIITINSEDGFLSQAVSLDTTQFSNLSNVLSGVNINVNNGIDTTNVIQFGSTGSTFNKQIEIPKAVFTNTGQTAGVGELVWNDQDGTLDLGLKGGNVTLQIGQEQLVRVVNKAGEDLLESSYQAVRVTGAQGNRLKVDLALATDDLNSAETIGLVTETILDNQEGFVTTSGLVRKINTTGSIQGETWTDGDILYLSPVTAGNITNIKPTPPQHTIVIGYVVRAHATQGSIFVKVENGWELDELHNVLIQTPLNGQTISYQNGLWTNKYITTASNGGSLRARQNHVNMPVFAASTPNNVEGIGSTISGGAARAFTGTSSYTRTQRMGLVTSTTGNAAQLRQTQVYFNRNSGYDVWYKFGMAENASDTGVYMFAGLVTSFIFSAVDPTTLTNCIGVAKIPGSNNLHVIHNDSSGLCTTIDLGILYPINTIETDMYLVNIYVSGSNIVVQIDKQDTNITSVTTISTNMPTATQGLNFGMYIYDSSGASVATGVDFMGMTVRA